MSTLGTPSPGLAKDSAMALTDAVFARGFDALKVQPPPAPNPHPWWLLHEAITYAVVLQDKHGKVPWIKTGEQILTPEQITEFYITMGDVGTFGSKT